MVDQFSRRTVLQYGSAMMATSLVPGGVSAIASTRLGRVIDLTIGVCTSVDSGAVLAEEGAAYAEVSCHGWLVPHLSDEEFQPRLEKIRACPVPVRACNSFLPGSMQATGPDADHQPILDYAAVAFERAKRAGIEVITFGSSGARSIPRGFPVADAELQFAALLARMGPLAAEHDVTVCVEPLQKLETNFINRVSQAARIVRAVQHPNVGITADIFHMLREGEGPEAIGDAGAIIRHVHIAEKARRSAPGNDGDDFRPYLKALSDIGFDGLFSIECGWSDLAAELPVAMTTLREQAAGV